MSYVHSYGLCLLINVIQRRSGADPKPGTRWREKAKGPHKNCLLSTAAALHLNTGSWYRTQNFFLWCLFVFACVVSKQTSHSLLQQNQTAARVTVVPRATLWLKTINKLRRCLTQVWTTHVVLGFFKVLLSLKPTCGSAPLLLHACCMKTHHLLCISLQQNIVNEKTVSWSFTYGKCAF